MLWLARSSIREASGKVDVDEGEGEDIGKSMESAEEVAASVESG
jgi:hypothetical protein